MLKKKKLNLKEVNKKADVLRKSVEKFTKTNPELYSLCMKLGLATVFAIADNPMGSGNPELFAKIIMTGIYQAKKDGLLGSVKINKK